MSVWKSTAAGAALMLAAACSPVFDWRELRPEGSGITLMLPCKPDRHARSLVLAGQPVRMEMLVCAAGDSTFALSFADVGEPAGVSPALEDLRRQALGNVSGRMDRADSASVPGMTPNPNAQRLSITGHLPDGRSVVQHAVFFTKGLRAYQASVIGTQPSAEVVDTFIASLRLAP